ncbi:MAG: DNA repair protein RadC [Rikenellaceae bacterium]
MYTLKDKLLARGVEALSDQELLSVLLDDISDNEAVAGRILEHYSSSLARISTEDISRLRMVEGVGLKRAQRMVVACEWGRRCAIATASEQLTIHSSNDVVALFRPLLESLKHEECWVLYLNTANRVIEQQRVSQGGVTSTVVDPRLIIKRALELLATHLVIVHNHPSGSVDPSEADIQLTQKIKSAAALFDINILDHIIISYDSEYSFLGDKKL